MKRLALVFLALCMCLTPIMAYGCDSGGHTLKDVYSKYESIAKGANTSEFFTNGGSTPSSTNPIRVTFNSDVINEKKLDTSNSMYIITAVYEPLLEMSSKFYVSTRGAFRLQIDTNKSTGASKSQINALYKKLERVEYALTALAQEKKTFELLEQGSGYRVNDFLVYYKEALDALFDFNMSYAELYLDGIFSYKDYSTQSIDISDAFDQETAKVYFYYCEMRLGRIAFDYYVNSYSFSADPKKIGDISAWLGSLTELNNLMDIYRGSKVSSSANVYGDRQFKITSDNVSRVRAALIDFQRSIDEFNNQTSMFYTAIGNFNLQEYFAESSTGKTYYLDNCTVVERACFDFAQNYLRIHFQGYVGWLGRMNSIFE